MISDYQFNINAVPVLVAAIGTLTLGLILIVKKRADPVSSHFAALCGGIFVWLTCTAMGYMSSSSESALQWFRCDNAGVMFISPSFFAFSARLTRSAMRPAILTGYGIAILFAAFALFTHFPTIGVQHYWWGFFPRWSFLRSIPFFCFFFGFMMAAFVTLKNALNNEIPATERVQVRYVVTAFMVAYFGSVDYLPTFGHSFYPLGYIPIVAMASILFYTVVKHRLMDIDLILRDTTLHAVTAGLIGVVAFLVIFPLTTYSPYAASAAAITLTVASMMFVYDPLRRILQPAIDRVLFANRFAYLEELNQIPNDLLEFTNLREMLKFLVTRLQEAAQLKYVMVMMYDPAHQSYISTIRHPDAAVQDSTMWTLPQNSAVVIRLQENPKSLLLNDEGVGNGLAEDKLKDELDTLSAGACFSVMKQSELVGLVVLGPKQSGSKFNQRDLDVLKALQHRLENFLLQALVVTQESLNMVKDSHDMKNDVNALKGRIGLKRYKMKTLLRSVADKLTTVGGNLKENQVDEQDVKLIYDVKTSVMSLMTDLIEQLPLEEDALDRLTIKLRNWSEYGRLVNEGFQGVRRVENIDVTQVGQLCIQRLLPAAERKGVALVGEIEEALYVRGEKSLVEQIMENLVDNAIKSTDRGSVRLKCRRKGDKINIDVVDTGCGIPAEDLPTITKKPFYQGNGRNTLERSTGVGLILVGHYAKSLGGEIKVESVVGEGTTFHVILPASESVSQAA